MFYHMKFICNRLEMNVCFYFVNYREEKKKQALHNFDSILSVSLLVYDFLKTIFVKRIHSSFYSF